MFMAIVLSEMVVKSRRVSMAEANVFLAVFHRRGVRKEHLMATHDGFSGLGGIIVQINSLIAMVTALLLLVEKVPVGLRVGA